MPRMHPMRGHHMTSEEFRRRGREVIDLIADYLDTIEQRPVMCPLKPGEVRAKLPPAAPLKSESFDDVLRDVRETIIPGLTHWQSPNFFAYFPCNASGPAILGELLSAGLGVQGMLWATSPACTELETHVLDWLVDFLGLPLRFKSDSEGGGVIQDTASSAALVALVAARERAGSPKTLTAYCSSQAHSSIEKAMVIAGCGRENLRAIEADERFRMKPDALEAAIRADLARGCAPFFVTATVGTTSSGAVDPVRAIGDVIQRTAPRAWLHVDAAMSGTAALCPEFRFIHEGLELADSYCFNPHKWMFTNFDCTAFWVADRNTLIRALSVLPEYLKNQATTSGAVIDYRDWQIPLGRRFRALKLWFVLRHYGLEGLQHHVREHVRLAQEFASWMRKDRRFELIEPPMLNLVCFRLRSGDEPTQRLMERLNQSGKLHLSHTRLNERFTLRLCIGVARTEQRHVEAAWNLIQSMT